MLDKRSDVADPLTSHTGWPPGGLRSPKPKQQSSTLCHPAMKPIKVETDDLTDVTWIQLIEGKVHHTVPLFDYRLLVDFDEDNHIMGIEIL